MYAEQNGNAAGEGGRSLSRQDFLKGLGAAGFLAGGGVALSGENLAFAAGLDPVQRHALDSLGAFTGWLRREKTRGYIGEVGWAGDERERFADGPKWNTLARKWYGWADRAGLWVTAHDANERQLYGGYWMSIYTSVGRDRERAISRPKAHAPVVEAHPTTGRYLRGLNMPSGQNINRDVFHQGNLGSFNEVGENAYWYSGIANDGPGGKNSFEYLRGRGIRLVRLGFRWERFMPGGPGTRLRDLEILRFKSSVDAAGKAGMDVVLDCHNYGGYYFQENGRGVRHSLNSRRLEISHFVDMWAKVSDAFKHNSTVVAYDLMNEPYNDGGIARGRYASEARAWEDATQRALSRIRQNADGTLIMVPVYCGVGSVPRVHPKKWISDRAQRHMYTAHQYFDTFRGPGTGTGGGRYFHSYSNEADYLRR